MPHERAKLVRQEIGLLKPDELAAVLDVSVETITTWRHEGTGPDYIRAGKQIRYRVADVDKWLDLNTVTVDRVRTPDSSREVNRVGNKSLAKALQAEPRPALVA
jgi:predicted site-specific integrase-resolvase